MYHTQEKKGKRLTQPIFCTRDDAWLGDAFYFWDDEIDAIHWGNNSKKRTGYFEIYKAEIDFTDVLDTVFNEQQYKFWVKQLEKAAKFITIKTGFKPTIKEVNQYFKEKAKWSDLADGILFQDLPYCEDLLVKGFNYRKRIQLAAYDLRIVNNFSFHSEAECN